MTEEEHVEDAITEFLGGCNVPNAPPIIVPSLHLTNDQLLVETETLLSTFNSSPVNDQEQFAPEARQNVDKTSSRRSKTNRNTMSADERRKRHNDQAAKRRMKYLHKLKNEKETLQQEVVELTSELTRLQTGEMYDKIRQVSNVSLSVWKANSARQKEKREEAEHIQRQLRAAVIDRARMIYQMNALVQQPIIPVKPKVCAGGGAGGNDGAELFKSFVGELDALYAQTDKLMQVADFKMASTVQFKPKRKKQQTMEFFDSADASILPFGFEEVSRAVSISMMADPNAELSHESAYRDTFSMKYQLECEVEPGIFSILQGYGAMRKYEESDRVVYVSGLPKIAWQ